MESSNNLKAHIIMNVIKMDFKMLGTFLLVLILSQVWKTKQNKIPTYCVTTLIEKNKNEKD